ncbi:MAG: hypothetical protein KJP27_06775 [Altererythrobacter sp.]|nr:hypothetical protein [Altererythrobacter sp.]
MAEPKTVAMEGPQGRGAAISAKVKEAKQRGEQIQDRVIRQTSGVQGRSFDAAQERLAKAPKQAAQEVDLERQQAEQEKALRTERLAEIKAPVLPGLPKKFPTRPASVNDALSGATGGPGLQHTGTTEKQTTRPNVDAAATSARMADAIQFEAQYAAAQGDAKAAGLGIRSDLYNDLKLGQQEQVFPLIQAANQIFDDANKQLAGIQELADDVRANRINPGQFFANVGDAGTFAASMAVAAGHLAAAMGGGPNTALSVINGAIDRNMRAQELNQLHDRMSLTAQIQIFDRMRSMGVDRLNQANVYNSLLISQAQSALEANAAASASEETRAQIGIIQARLAQQKIEFDTRIAGTIVQSAQMKHFALVGSAQKTAQRDVIGEAQAILNNAQDQPVEEQLSLLHQYQLQNNVQFSDVDLANLQKFNPQLMDVPSSHLRIANEGEVIVLREAGTQEEFEIRPNQRFFNLKDDGPNSKENVLRKIEGQYEYANNWKRIAELGSEMQVRYSAEGLRGAIAVDKEGHFTLRGANDDPKLQELVIRMNKGVEQNARALQGKMEAIRGPGEQAILAKRAGLPGDGETMAGMLFGDSDMFNLLYPGAKIALDGARVDIAKYTQ